MPTSVPRNLHNESFTGGSRFKKKKTPNCDGKTSCVKEKKTFASQRWHAMGGEKKHKPLSYWSISHCWSFYVLNHSRLVPPASAVRSAPLGASPAAASTLNA
jgi:uncharacterized FlgJ-related protein